MKTETKDCDCLDKTAESIKAKVIADQSEKQRGYKYIQGEWDHSSVFPKERLYSNFIITSTYEKKDGSTSKPNKKHIAIFYSYCPFCGKQLSK